MRTEDSTDLKAAREILDADHHGLEDVKDRIVEYLAVRARRASADCRSSAGAARVR
ncbi:lon protease domain protein [Mycobacterium xenopi 4042]|uniref:Lon protease domain protein n=1 Tax=Mycobacterium xenopi 4042 TaxID=1299334 RepID=X8BHI7_MYCXE|nr:lon protease domain protein [Mycobacterium xenopi 4042]